MKIERQMGAKRAFLIPARWKNPGRKGGRPGGNKKGDFVPGKVGDPSQEQIPCSFPELPEKTDEKVKCGRSTAY